MSYRSICHLAILCLIGSGVSSPPLRADDVTFAFTGVVTQVGSPLTSQFSIGDAFAGSYTFDSDTPDTDAGSTGFYEDLISAGQVSFANGYVATYSAGGTNESIVDDDPLFDVYDLLFKTAGPAVSGATLDVFSIGLLDFDGTMLSSDALLTVPPDLSTAEVRAGFLRFLDAGRTPRVDFDLTSLRLVPEPSTAILLSLFGVGLLACRPVQRSRR